MGSRIQVVESKQNRFSFIRYDACTLQRLAIVASLAFGIIAVGAVIVKTATAVPRAHVAMTVEENDLVVTNTADDGDGSLRQAILSAIVNEGPDTIIFDAKVFAEPQTITLESELPELVGQLTIDGYIPNRLWRASGVTVSGNARYRVFKVGADGKVKLSFITVADGRASDGGGILNQGSLVVKGVTLVGNSANETGGGLANYGVLTVINSTFANNSSSERGGGLVGEKGNATISNCTFSGNKAKRGGGLFSSAALLLSNTILANSIAGGDCVATGELVPESTHNLIEVNDGCGTPINTEDPNLEPLGYFNGPTKTFPLGGGSPAINLGDNASALDENGESLTWDQRGNGDPRFVAGYTDIGAFERQRHPFLSVDTVEDSGLRACTHAGVGDCPLRGALELANATPAHDVITFDPRVFAEAQTLVFDSPLPEITAPLTVDASSAAGVTLDATGSAEALRTAQGINLTVRGPLTMNGIPPTR